MPAIPDSATDSTITVDVDELVLGRALSCPIFDPNGVLLLAAGSLITAEQMQRIKDRGVGRIVISQEDLASTTLYDSLATEAASSVLDRRIAERLESVMGAGLLRIVNQGPPVHKNLVRHGRAVPDPELGESLRRQNEATSESIGRMMTRLEGGGKVRGSQVDEMATLCIDNLITDIDATLCSAFEQYQPTLAKHAVKVATLGMAIGIELGLDVKNLRDLGTIGFVQDWGMVRVSKKIIEAKRVLTPSEFVEIQKHPAHTMEILERVPGLTNLARMVVYQIHERPDGSGYPRGREGKTIHLFAKILHVADAYTALTSLRPYRPALMPYGAMMCLLAQARRNKVDPEVVRSLLAVLSLFPIGSFVSLSDGSIARVMRTSIAGYDYTRPIVGRLLDKQGRQFDPNDDSSLIDLSASDLSITKALPTPGRDEIGFSPEILLQSDQH